MKHALSKPLQLAAWRVVSVVVFGLGASKAWAYPWMIRHGYATCSACHADPSGSGLLTEYGRAQGEILLRMPYTKAADEEPSKIKDFLFGALQTPPQILLGGSLRGAYLNTQSSSFKDARWLLMQADLYGQISIDRIRVNGSIGWGHRGAYPAALTRNAVDNLVSRQHWIGVDIGADRQWLLRAGRINIPYGLRSNEHTMWVRSSTRSDINASQQHGLALAYITDPWRTEAMAMFGNFQVSPDRYRERGAAGYVEHNFGPKVSAGLSAMVTYAQSGLRNNRETLRQAYGVFGRFVPTMPVVLSGQLDLLLEQTGATYRPGYAGLCQVDYEPTQGLHFIGAVETRMQNTDNKPAVGGWGGVQWFILPHTDIRTDIIYRSIDTGKRIGSVAWLAQLHVYL